MGKIKKFKDYCGENELPESEININEGVAEPTVRPTTKPTTAPNQTPSRRPSPLRRDKPSVVPAPKAISVEKLADRFLNLTKNNKVVNLLLTKKYNK